MKTYLDCIPCFIQQTLKAGRLITRDEKVIKEMLDKSGALIEQIPMSNTPAETGAMIYESIRKISGVNDPYKEIKNLVNS